jgi:integrase
VYLRALFDEGLKVKTIERALAGIVFTHRSRGFSWTPTELIAETLNGIRRQRAEAGEKITKKTAITREILASMVGKLGVDLVGLRNRAILTLTWAGCARRSEISGLDVANLAFVPEGLIIAPKKTKTDQQGKNTEKGILYANEPALCAVRATSAWLKAASITTGPVFRGIRVLRTELEVSSRRLSDRSIAQIVKDTVESAGFDPETFSGHSLRAGFITTAAQQDVPDSVIASQSGHKSQAVMQGYVRHANLFTKNAGRGLL